MKITFKLKRCDSKIDFRKRTEAYAIAAGRGVLGANIFATTLG